MNGENTCYKQSVTAVVIRAGKVLLARHTYGAGKNMLIVPGGYLNKGETPEHAVKREYLEETGVLIMISLPLRNAGKPGVCTSS